MPETENILTRVFLHESQAHLQDAYSLSSPEPHPKLDNNRPEAPVASATEASKSCPWQPFRHRSRLRSFRFRLKPLARAS
jgi:hypothetical protein